MKTTKREDGEHGNPLSGFHGSALPFWLSEISENGKRNASTLKKPFSFFGLPRPIRFRHIKKDVVKMSKRMSKKEFESLENVLLCENANTPKVSYPINNETSQIWRD